MAMDQRLWLFKSRRFKISRDNSKTIILYQNIFLFLDLNRFVKIIYKSMIIINYITMFQ